MRSPYSLLFLALVSICTACKWEAFFQDGETYFEGRVTYKSTGKGAIEANILIVGEKSMGFSGGQLVSSDTIPVNEEGYFEVLLQDNPDTDHYIILVLVGNAITEIKSNTCNDNVSNCSALDPDCEHSVIIEI